MHFWSFWAKYWHLLPSAHFVPCPTKNNARHLFTLSLLCVQSTRSVAIIFLLRTKTSHLIGLFSGWWKKKGPSSFPRPTPPEESWYVKRSLFCKLSSEKLSQLKKVGHHVSWPSEIGKKWSVGNLKKNRCPTNWKTCPTFNRLRPPAIDISNDQIEMLWQTEFSGVGAMMIS